MTPYRDQGPGVISIGEPLAVTAKTRRVRKWLFLILTFVPVMMVLGCFGPLVLLIEQIRTTREVLKKTYMYDHGFSEACMDWYLKRIP